MTLTLKPKINKSLGSQIPDNIRNQQTIVALKRYLDLTLTGTKKDLAEHSIRGMIICVFHMIDLEIQNFVDVILLKIFCLITFLLIFDIFKLFNC